MTERVYRRWTGRPPKNESVARDLIASELGATRGLAYVFGPDGVAVQVSVDNVLRHVRRIGKRWHLVPLIRPALSDAYRLSGQADGPGQLLYSARLRVTPRTQHGQRLYLASHVEEDKRGRRYLKTCYDLPKGRLGKKEKEAGHILWPRPNYGHSNPAPARQVSTGLARPGRTPVAPNHHNTDQGDPSRGLWLFGLLVGLAALLNSREINRVGG